MLVINYHFHLVMRHTWLPLRCCSVLGKLQKVFLFFSRPMKLSSDVCSCCCCVASVVSDSVRPHRWQPIRLRRPWDSPVKNTGVGCHFLLQCMKVKRESEVTQLCPTLRDPMDCSLPGSSVHGIFQARGLEWAAISFSAEGWPVLIATQVCPPAVIPWKQRHWKHPVVH